MWVLFFGDRQADCKIYMEIQMTWYIQNNLKLNKFGEIILCDCKTYYKVQ